MIKLRANCRKQQGRMRNKKSMVHKGPEESEAVDAEVLSAHGRPLPRRRPPARRWFHHLQCPAHRSAHRLSEEMAHAFRRARQQRDQGRLCRARSRFCRSCRDLSAAVGVAGAQTHPARLDCAGDEQQLHLSGGLQGRVGKSGPRLR